MVGGGTSPHVHTELQSYNVGIFMIFTTKQLLAFGITDRDNAAASAELASPGPSLTLPNNLEHLF